MPLTIDEIDQRMQTIETRMDQVDRRPAELTGMLPFVIRKIVQLGKDLQAQGVKFSLVRGYDAESSKDGFHYWGCGVDIECTDYVQLRKAAKSIGFTWTDVKCSHSGHLEFTNELTIKDFQTFRVNGDLKLVEEVRLNKIN